MVDHKMNDIEKKFKPICCHVCQRTFTVKQSLNRHIQVVHEKLKPFPCNICQKTFKRKDSLIGHIQTIHETLKPFPCNIYSISTLWIATAH